MSEFYCQKIDVKLDKELRSPVSFTWRGVKYKVVKVQDAWQDFGFGPLAPERRDWRHRHHRNYYRVRIEGGKVFEIYFDRGTKLRDKKEWILYRRVT